jgi:hypothetical protein
MVSISVLFRKNLYFKNWFPLITVQECLDIDCVCLLPNSHLFTLFRPFPHSYTLVCLTFTVENDKFLSRPEHTPDIWPVSRQFYRWDSQLCGCDVYCTLHRHVCWCRLESPTRSLEVRAPLGVLMESRAGDISASCLTDLKLQSVAGAVSVLWTLNCRGGGKCAVNTKL